jgi:hypothetical protein
MEQRHPAAKLAARIVAVAGVLLAIVGLYILYGQDSESGVAAVGNAFQVVIGGAFLIAAGLIGVGAICLWLIAQRRKRRLR